MCNEPGGDKNPRLPTGYKLLFDKKGWRNWPLPPARKDPRMFALLNKATLPLQSELQPVLIPEKYHSASDKERISEILFVLSDAVHNRTKPLQNIHRIGPWGSPAPELAPIFPSVEEMQTSITDLRSILLKIGSENVNYKGEIGLLINPGDTAIEKLQMGLNNYHDALAAFRDDPSARSERLLTMSRESVMQTGYNPFHQWMTHCQKRIEAPPKALKRWFFAPARPWKRSCCLPLFPDRQERTFRPGMGIIGTYNAETAVLIPQIASAILALAFSAFMLLAGQSFIERQAEKHDVMHLQNLMHLPAIR
jgi:hypothetical protein